MSDIVRIPPTLRELIPISHLALELPSPGVDWASYLRNRGIEVTSDDVGRPAVSRQVVKQLIQEQNDAEARAHEAMAERDAWHERMRVKPVGLPVEQIIDGLSPAASMGFHDRPGAGRKTLDAGAIFRQSDEIEYIRLPAEDES
jgi:hypothetical protein